MHTARHPWRTALAFVALMVVAGAAAAQPANVTTESERGSGTHMSREPKSVAQPSNDAGKAVRSNPGGLGTLNSPRPSVPGGKDEPTPRNQAGQPGTPTVQAPLKGSERRGSGGAALNQAREPSTNPKESAAQ